MRILLLTACVLFLLSCDSPPAQPAKPAQIERPAPLPKPADESRRFPQANLVSTQVVDAALLGKSFMPGGTLARYRKGNTEYQIFIAKAASPTDAAIKLGEWRTALAKPEFVASFGGYFGQDATAPVFVFTKESWIAGVVGLPRSQADTVSRSLASRL
jgi:hypothetical protein